MGKTTLVTGASSGIGLELARAFARRQHDLILVARLEDKLKAIASELAQQYGIVAHTMAADLTRLDAPEAIFREVQADGIAVEYLVNNAGFASYGFFAELDRQNELDMVQLNIAALVNLTHLFVGPMIARRSGAILNVASTAAFQPGPLMATYYATKAFVLSFSESLANELKEKGVTVSALCPGPTASGFQVRANMEDSRLVQRGLMEAATVAEAGYLGLKAGKTLIVPGAANRIGALLPRFIPRNLVTRFVRAMQERIGH